MSFPRSGVSRKIRAAFAFVCSAQVLILTGVASAQTPLPGLSAPAERDQVELVPVRDVAPRLDGGARFGIGLDAYTGLALLSRDGEAQSHALVGGLSRLRVGYFQLGAAIELSDRSADRYRSIGGFVGAFLPYRNWIDVELAAGVTARRYINPDQSYGPAGYDLGLPAITLKLGISDRSSEAVLAARLGAAIVAALDLGRHDAAWRYELAPGIFEEGNTRIGGVSIGIVASAGFDVGVRPRASKHELATVKRERSAL